MKFIVSNWYERWRAKTWLTKEPGTVAWLRAQLRSGDVFYDVGANVGVYTLLAAEIVGPTGQVIAFEPHLFTAGTLIRNVQANGFTDRVQVITSALWDDDTFLPFHYQHVMAGSSGSQLRDPIDENGKTFVPELTEWKHVTKADSLIWHGLNRPQVIKIDVDGHELSVLRGMRRILDVDSLQSPVRSLQVEVHPKNGLDIRAWLEKYDFAQTGRHRSSLGEASIAEGCDPEKVFANAVYTRAA